MRNFIILCRLHTEQVLHAAFSGLKTSKKDPKAITAVLILAVFSVLMSALYGFLFAGMMTQSGIELFYFPTMLLLSLFFGFLFSFMGAKDVLFFREGPGFPPVHAGQPFSCDALPHGCPLSGKPFICRALDAACQCSGAVFSIAPAPALWLSFLPVMLLFPLLPAFFAALCGFLFAWTQARQHKNALLGSLLTMLLLCVILFFCLQADRLAELLFTNRDGLLHILDTYLFPLRLVSDGICGSFPALTGGLFLCALPYAAFAALLSRYYKRILSALQARTLRHDFRLSALQKSSPFCALLKSELYRLTRSSLYLTNTCFGIVFLTGITFFLLSSRERPDMLLPLIGGPRLLTPMLFLAAMFFLSTVYPSCISISLDGKALWLLKEAPLPAPVLFGAKACLNLVLTWPTCLVSLLLPGLAGIIPLSDSFFLLLPGLSVTAFWAVSGLLLNLVFPKTDCPSESAVIKNSASAVLGIFGNMLSVLLIAGIWALCTFVLSVPLPALCLILFFSFSGLTFLCWHTLLTWGTKRFAQID